MKLYEYTIKAGKVTVKEYEVTETAKLIKSKTPIQYRYLNQLPKEDLEKVIKSYFNEFYFYSLTDDLNKAVEKFMEYYRNVVIPSSEKRLELEKSSLERAKGVLNSLTEQKES